MTTCTNDTTSMDLKASLTVDTTDVLNTDTDVEAAPTKMEEMPSEWVISRPMTRQTTNTIEKVDYTGQMCSTMLRATRRTTIKPANDITPANKKRLLPIDFKIEKVKGTEKVVLHFKNEQDCHQHLIYLQDKADASYSKDARLLESSQLFFQRIRRICISVTIFM